MSGDIVTKSVVSVTEMARMVGLSRARFYQLVKRGTFPPADQDQVSQRPCYCEEKQRLILEARRRNCGVDGKAILFYARRRDCGHNKTPVRPAKPKSANTMIVDLIDHLAEVKIVTTVAQVEAAVKEDFPQGIEGVEFAIVFHKVYQRLRRQNPAGSEGR
jgi:hypothetical protein